MLPELVLVLYEFHGSNTMKAHIIQDGKVVNNVEVDNLHHPDGLLMVWASGNSDIGWDYIDGQFVDNRPAPPQPPTPPTPTKEELLMQIQALQTKVLAIVE